MANTNSFRQRNRYLATPVRKNIGTNTMQMARVETNAGIAICDAPVRIASSTSLPSSRLRLIFRSLRLHGQPGCRRPAPVHRGS